MPKLSIREITSKVPIHTSPPYIQLFLIRDCPIQEKDEEGAFKRYIALIKEQPKLKYAHVIIIFLGIESTYLLERL